MRKKMFFLSVYHYGQQKLNHSVSFWKDVKVRALQGDFSGRGPR